MKSLINKQSSFYTVTVLEYILTHVINLVLIIFAFLTLKNSLLLAIINKKQELHFKWIKTIFVLLILLLIATLINGIITLFDFTNYKLHLQYESALYALFFFALIFSIIQFPVFAFTGNYNDLKNIPEIKKYEKSSLKESIHLFNQIDELVINEKLYLLHDLKLNTIAEKLNTSIHHISQAINENAKKSFPDYINQYRIRLAKQKLLEPKPDTIFAIAIDVGFNTKANFYYAFKKITGTTPINFRKENINS
ncbi:helix-turn-helix domain-containing protein [Tenacibaculum aiptasiae]|uniref:helix-turn-helix domain-containing protein n=1 Tax=Tenacibaculum aiptasiae TaxID=426481 RepID=UPI002330F085|nr:helix-turn-helix domain-containing protein [Tenacibaculum aiptasiae]